MSVYLRAAKLVDTPFLSHCGTQVYRGCCHALDLAGRTDGDHEAFAAMFKDDGAGWYWWGRPTAKTRQPRVLALLFMHWMTR